MQLDVIQSDHAPSAIGPYSHAVVANGLVFTSGQTGEDPATGGLVEGGVEAETEQALNNLTEVLKAAGTSLDCVVKSTVFISDMKDFAAMNKVYSRFFGSHKPARSTVAVVELAPPAAKVEIELIAIVGLGENLLKAGR